MPTKMLRARGMRWIRTGIIPAISLVVLAIFTGGGALASGDIAALIKKLDRAEWEIVSEAVIERLPNLIRGNVERAYFNKLMQSSQEVVAIAEAIEFGDYEGLGAISANIAASNLEAMVASRFGEGSRLYRSIQIVKKDPELAKALTRAALNADAYAANRAIRSSLRKYAESRSEELRQQGEKFWKDMVRSVIPGGSRLAGLGFDPVDIYLQGISDWSDFAARTRLRFNNTMLDCLAIRYRKVLDDGYNRGGARLEIENFDTGTGFGGGFNCSLEMDRLEGSGGEKSATQRLVDFFTRSGRSTAALGALNLTSSEIVDLIEGYENDGGREKTRRFSDWLQDRLLTNIETRAKGLTGAIEQDHKRVADAQIAEANRLLAAVRGEIARLERRKDGNDNQFAGGGTGGVNGDPPKNGNDGGADQPQRPVTAKCEILTDLLASTGRQLAGGVRGDTLQQIVAVSQAVAGAQAEGTCKGQVYADADDIKSRLEAAARLIQKVNGVLARCDVDSIPTLLAELASSPLASFANEISLLQTAKTGVDLISAGSSAYENGNYRRAKSNLQRSLDAFGELSPGTCQTYVDRARRGLEIIAEIEVAAARVSRAINACDLADMRAIITTFPAREKRFYTRAADRVKAALPDCENKDRIIAAGNFCEAAEARFNAARNNFLTNRLKLAERQLRELLLTLSPDKTEYCPELNPLTRRGLDNIAGLRAQNRRLRQAVKACDVERLQTMATRFGGRTHPWYTEASARAAAAIASCKTTTTQTVSPACREVADIVDTAKAELAAGQVVVALRGLYAADLMAGQSPDNCEPLGGQITAQIAAAETIEVVVARSQTAIETCDVASFNSVESDLISLDHPAASSALTKFYANVDLCEEDGEEADRDAGDTGEIVITGRTEPAGNGEPADLEGNWAARGIVVISGSGKRMELPVNFDFVVSGGQVNTRKTDNMVAMQGRVDGGTIRFSGQQTSDGATVGAEFKGELKDDGTLSGQITMLFPEAVCLGKAIGGAIGEGAAGALGAGGDESSDDNTCPTARYPGTWTAARR